MYKKIFLAVDCADDTQRDKVQSIMNEVSNMRLFNAAQILSAYPYFRQHQGELTQLFNMVSRGGVKSLMSAGGLSLITKLAKR
jgi:hypothetical protein